MNKLILILVLLITTTVSQATVKLTDYGAIPDDDISDCRALENAITAVYLTKGGTIEFPPGRTLLKCATEFNLTRYGVKNHFNITLQGVANSFVEIDGSQSFVTFYMGNMNVLRVTDLTFVGADPNKNGTDASDPLINTHTLFYMTTVRQAIFENVKFVGVGARQDMIYAYDGNLIMQNVYFGGSAAFNAMIKTRSGYFTGSNIMMVDWSDDLGRRYSLSPFIFTKYAYYHNAPNDYPEIMTRGVISINNMTIDEGSRFGIVIENNYSARLSNIKMNLSGTLAASVIEFDNVPDAIVDGVWASWKEGTVIRGRNGSHIEARGVIRNSAISGIVESEVDDNSTIVCTKCMVQ